MGERAGVSKKKSSKSMNQVEPSKNKSAKAWEQSKGDSAELNHNYYRWLQSALNSAVGEHRWEDAFKLLPCLILHRCYNVSSDFLWRMMNIITKSAKEVPEGLGKSMSRDFLLLPTKTIVVVLDTLAEELETATDERINEILQMLEDYKYDRRSEKWSVRNKDVRLTSLIDAYRGLVLYSRWKNHTYSNQDSSAVQEKITGSLEDISDEENEDGSKDGNRRLVTEAHSALRRALCNLAEPVEWIIVPYLDLENELRGPESALSVLQDYVSKNLQHLPAQHLVYNFLRTFVPNSNETQMSALKEITRVCPEHPLTLEYVDRLLAEACDEEVWRRTETAVDSDEMESKASVNQSSDSETETQSCGLKSDIQVESLVRALNLLTNLLEYKEWRWKLQPWQTLTHLLRKFYSSWLRCWKCPYCRKSRKSVRQVSKSVTPLWKYYVWVPVPVSLTPEKAQVIFHHIYSAHVFCYNQTYVRDAISTLRKANYKVLCNELKESLYPQKTYLDKFLAYSLKKSDFQMVDSVEVSSSTKTGEKEASTKKRKAKKNAVYDIQFSDDDLPPIVTRKKSVSKTLSELPFPDEDNKKSQRKGHTRVSTEPIGVKEVKSTVASKLTSLSTPPTRNIKSMVRNHRPSLDEGNRETSFLNSDISFHEDFLLTSTQVRPGNKQILDTSLGESPALLPAHKERDTLREKEKSKLKLSKAKEKHRNVKGKQKDFEISSDDPDDCANEERSDVNNHTEASKLNSSSAEEYVTVNETTEETANITCNSNVKNAHLLSKKSITSSLNTTYTLESPMTSMASINEGSVQVNNPPRNKKRSSTDVCSTNIVGKTHDKTAECSSPEPEDYLPCGQRPREDRSSGYKGGSSEDQNESPLANTGNDSVYFCYTALPTHINPAVLVLDSQTASEQNNCLVEETLTETNSSPLDSYKGKCVIQETQSQEFFPPSVVGSTSEMTDFTNPNGCGLDAGKNSVKVECEDTGTQYSENSEPFSLTQGQQEPMPFSQNAQELVYSADVTDTTDFTTFCKTELTSPFSEKEYKIFEVQYEDIEEKALSPSTLEVCNSVKEESVTVGNPTSVVHGTIVEFSDIDNDKFASPKCAVEEIIHSNCLDTPTAVASNEETSDGEEVIGPSQELVATSPPNFKSFNRSSRSCGSASGGSFVSNTSGESEQEQTSLSIYSSLIALQEVSTTVAESEKIGRKNEEKNILEVLPLNSSKGSVQEEMEYATLTSKEKQGGNHGKGLSDLQSSLIQNQRGDVKVHNTSSVSNITLVANNKEPEILDVLCERPVKSDHNSDESFVTAESVGDRLSRESLQSVDTNDDSESQNSNTSKLRIDISNSRNSSVAETTAIQDRCDQNAKKNKKNGKTTENSDISATVDAHKNQGVDSVTNDVENTEVDSFETALNESQKGNYVKQKKKSCALELLEDMDSELVTNNVETFKSRKKKREKKPEITILPTMQVNDIPNSDEVDGSAYETSKKSKKGKEKKRKEKTLDKVSEKTKQTNLVSHSSKSKKKHKSDIIETEEACDKYWLDLCTDLPFPDLDKENEILVSENSSSKSKSHSTKTKNNTSKASVLKFSLIDSDELELPDFDNLVPEESIKEKVDTRKSSRNKNKKEQKERDKSEDQGNKKKCLESKEDVCQDVSESQEKKRSKKKKLQMCSGQEVDVSDIEFDKKHKPTNNMGQKVNEGSSLPTKREKKKHKKEKDDFITCDLLPFPDIEIEGCSISKAENETCFAKSEDGIVSQKKKRKNEDIDVKAINTKRKKKEYLETSTKKDIKKCNGDTSVKATPEVSQVNGHYDCTDLVKRKKNKKNKSKATEDELLTGFDVESVLDLLNEKDEYSKRDTEKKNKKRQRDDGTNENKEENNPENTKESEHNTPVEHRSENLRKRSKGEDTPLSKKEEQKESSSKNKVQEELRRINNKKNCLTPPWNRPVKSTAKFHKLYNPENDDLL
ncbi:uncharacterized protein LOC119569699 [Penaeus monodon]|uniref:uncharacterized protein LOC119569699 n=1 Tax=Penaeus monodon TaxID=6687 RepID=UPI0018A7A368|nr:uncharacterized protein LOC119569699 [Penaeus monodon]